MYLYVFIFLLISFHQYFVCCCQWPIRSFLFPSIMSSYMIVKESVNRAIIHRQYLHFQVENKIVAQIGQIHKKFLPCTLFSQKSPIIHVWQIPKYTIGFSCCKAYYLLSFRWSLLAVFLFLRYRNQVLFLSWSTVIFNCLFWLRYLSSFQNV